MLQVLFSSMGGRLQQTVQVTAQTSSCPAGESFTALKQKAPQVLANYRPDPTKKQHGKKQGERKIWRMMGSHLPRGLKGCWHPEWQRWTQPTCPSWEQHRHRHTGLPFRSGCICPEMRLQNWFLLNILSLRKASIGCYFLLLLVSP